ncbi:hypothetical protein [Paraburkholderia sp. BL23I1N1]|uniref:hypothetical protein n=1 Tax=Paraburkholderia sp. BL23I1N1 TaxID=1938802 RepID=UPI0011C42A2C|nr:hypothetical protein [Paraburkholderia sp. BL23I1N1]
MDAEAKKRRAPQRARRFSFAASNQRQDPFIVPQRMKLAPCSSGSRKKNPGLSPGKRYVIQRIGAFGQIKPCERQRHDAVACDNAGPAVRRAGVM